MDTQTFETILEKATSAALNAGCAEIQRALNISSGDVAGVHFSGSGADAVRDALQGYMGLELSYLADEAQGTPPDTHSEAPGDAEERKRWQAAERVKFAMLRTLEPLGFVDADDGEAPAALWHADLRLTIDAVRMPLASLLKHVHDEGREAGRAEIQVRLREIVGL